MMPFVVRRILQLTLSAVTGVVAVAGPASAHEQSLPTETVVDAVDLDVAGLTVEVVGSAADQLLLRNEGDATVEVLDEDGDAFLRIGPDGVEANLGERAWFEGNDPYGVVQADPGVRDGTAPDDWRLVSVEPAWTTYDHRLHPGDLELPDRVDRERTLAEWTVPLRSGDETGAVRGRILTRPVLGGFQPVLVDAPTDERVLAQLVPGAVPGFFVRVQGDARVTVLGTAGEPFLRLASDGVEANLASPSWFEHVRLADLEGPDVPVDPDGEPVWQSITGAASYTWLDPRAASGRDNVPVDADRAQVTATWQVPLQIDGDEVTLAGRTEWVPLPQPDDEDGPRWLLLAALCAGAAAAALLVARILPRRGPS